MEIKISVSDRLEVLAQPEMLARAVGNVVRNAIRFGLRGRADLLDALGSDCVPLAKLEEVDRFVLARYADVGLRVLDAYVAYEYGPIAQALNQFATVDLSLANLLTFPWVRALVEKGALHLHGAYFGVGDGVLLVRDPGTGAFRRLVEETPERNPA